MADFIKSLKYGENKITLIGEDGPIKDIPLSDIAIVDPYPTPMDKIALYNYSARRSIVADKLKQEMPYLSSVYRELILDAIGL